MFKVYLSGGLFGVAKLSIRRAESHQIEWKRLMTSHD